MPLLAYYPLICTTVHTLFKEFRLYILYCQISVCGEIYLIRFWNTQQIILTKASDRNESTKEEAEPELQETSKMEQFAVFSH